MKNTMDPANEGREVMEGMDMDRMSSCRRHHAVKRCFRLTHLIMASVTLGLAISAVCKLGKLRCDVLSLKYGLK